MTFSADLFIETVRDRFRSTLTQHGYVEAEIARHTAFTSVAFKSARMYVRIGAERRDGRVYLAIGQLAKNGSIPPLAIFAPGSIEEVQEFDLETVVWSATGDRGAYVDLGVYKAEDGVSMAAAVDEVATTMERYAGSILAGDEESWRAIAELMLRRGAPRVLADLNKRSGDFVLLTTIGTRHDLGRLGIVLSEGMTLSLWSDDADADGTQNNLEFEGVAHFDPDRNCWVATVDWSTMRHERSQDARR